MIDGLGSTTGLADGTGAVTDTYTYDVYGAVRTHTGTSGNEFTYTGEQVDATGLQYLRARYYDAATGRFASRDPLPLAQRYAYVGGNPVNLVDPTGLCHIIPCFDSPVPAPWPFAPFDAPDVPAPDIHFSPNVVDNWRRHINWAKKKLGGGSPEHKMFDPGYRPPHPNSLWPSPPQGLEDMRIPPGWCRENPKTCAALLALIAGGGFTEYLQESGVLDDAVNQLKHDKESAGGQWYSAPTTTP